MLSQILTFIGGVCWSCVYVDCIRTGFKQKTYCIPLFALGLNFAWELIYSVDALFVDAANLQCWVDLTWAALDAAVVYTYFKYGRKYFPEKAKRYFIPFSILVFAACFAIQFAFYFTFGGNPGANFSSFAQNTAMSILFLTTLFRRGGSQGQTMLIAVAKCIGTLAPALTGGLLGAFNVYIVLMGGVCFVFDVLYIVALYRIKKAEGACGGPFAIGAP